MKTEHQSQDNTKTELIFSEVMNRLRKALNLASDAELSRVLGISTSNFSNRKATNSLPFEAIVQVCLEKSIHMGWIFGGTSMKSELGRDQADCSIQLKLLGFIFAEWGYALSPDYDPNKNSHAQGYADSDKYGLDLLKGVVVGTIYNDVVMLKGKKQRQAIFEKMGKLAGTAQIYAVAREAGKRPIDD